jgi:uncharacterized membrane protein YcaP (DUF421 family)
MGLSAKPEELGFVQMAVRACVMYVALIAIVRLGKKRFLGNATAFDFILTVMIGSIAARAVTAGAPFFVSLLGIGTFVLMHWILSAAASRSAAFSHLVKGNATWLIRDGKVDWAALRRAHMSGDDLDEDLRQRGIRSPTQVLEARLERSGKLSVIDREP